MQREEEGVNSQSYIISNCTNKYTKERNKPNIQNLKRTMTSRTYKLLYADSGLTASYIKSLVKKCQSGMKTF